MRELLVEVEPGEFKIGSSFLHFFNLLNVASFRRLHRVRHIREGKQLLVERHL